MNVAVIGAGIMGCSAAYSLARRGHQVTLFEQFSLGHDRGSSHGRSRIVRRAYTDPYFTALMTEAYPLWRELDEHAGGSVLHQCGLVFVGVEDSPNVDSMCEGLSIQGAEFSILRESGSSCPFIKGPKEVAVHVKEAGWVAADKAIDTLLLLIHENGGTIRPNTKLPTDVDFNSDGFDAAIITVGSWTQQWAPSLPVTVTKQTFAYLEVPYQGGPVWIMDGELGTYGFPPEPGTNLVKIGIHRRGMTVYNCDEFDRSSEQADLEEIKRFGSTRLGLQSPAPVEPKTCLYTSTSTEDFQWGTINASIPTYFASPCSGHGFKFGPWIGERLADFVDGHAHPTDWPRFAIKSR